MKLDFDEDARRRYTRAFDEYRSGLQTIALRSGGRYAGVATSQSLESVIFGDLIRARGHRLSRRERSRVAAGYAGKGLPCIS